MEIYEIRIKYIDILPQALWLPCFMVTILIRESVLYFPVINNVILIDLKDF